MNLRRLLTILLVFAIGLGVGIALTYHPAPTIPPALYKTETYFSPNGGVASNIIKAINSTKASSRETSLPDCNLSMSL